jgi:diguanylate cyclase (GGDEF)-like protein
MAMFTLLALGEYPYSNIIRNIPAIGSFFEIILFSLLLAYRINTLKEQKLASQEKLLEQQRTESSRLFHTIAEKTKKLKSMNQRLQQELKKSKELENELMKQATTDPLTGLLNRRAFFDACTREIEEVHRHGNALSILILDIDKFKDVNDTYGHDVGDIVIKHIAEKMVENTRTIDYVGRIGGEEFTVLMPSTDIENAFEIADRLRSKISRDAIEINKFTIKVSVSIGVSEMKNKKTDIREIMKNADNALYKAKRNGRNRVCKKGC